MKSDDTKQGKTVNYIIQSQVLYGDEHYERQRIHLTYYYGMAKNEYIGLNLEQTLRKLKIAFKDKGISWSDEFTHYDYVDFMLSYK